MPEDSWFQKFLGCSYNDARKVGDTVPIYFNNNRPGRRVPGPPGTVLIYRAATRKGLDSSTGFFEIVPGSYSMTANEIRQTKAKVVKLEQRDILFLVANNTVEYNSSGDAIALREAVSADL